MRIIKTDATEIVSIKNVGATLEKIEKRGSTTFVTYRLADFGKKIVSESSMKLFQKYQKYVEPLEGDIVEVGVHKGRSARELIKWWPDKTVHLFDTFTGIPYIDTEKDDKELLGYCNNTSIEEVERFLEKLDNVRFHIGVFPDTASQVEDKKFCLGHFDVDVYPATKACLEFFYPRMVKGGLMICHDYRHEKCRGVTVAVDEFFEDKPERIEASGLSAYIFKE